MNGNSIAARVGLPATVNPLHTQRVLLTSPPYQLCYDTVARGGEGWWPGRWWWRWANQQWGGHRKPGWSPRCEHQRSCIVPLLLSTRTERRGKVPFRTGVMGVRQAGPPPLQRLEDVWEEAEESPLCPPRWPGLLPAGIWPPLPLPCSPRCCSVSAECAFASHGAASSAQCFPDSLWVLPMGGQRAAEGRARVPLPTSPCLPSVAGWRRRL